MKKYKLIKTYPGSPKLGSIAYNDNTKFFQVDIARECKLNIPKYTRTLFGQDVENNSEYWEEIIEKDYEILSFENKDENSGCWSPLFHPLYHTIISIRRISDNKIFTIGDKVRISKLQNNGSFIIDEFYFDCNNDKLLCNGKYTGNGHVSITKIEKSKQPLFQTIDGIDIFDGDDIWYLPNNNNKFKCINNVKATKLSAHISHLYFFSKEAAEDYTLKNKPCLNFNDIINYFNKWYGTNTKDNFQDGLKKLIQTKL